MPWRLNCCCRGADSTGIGIGIIKLVYSFGLIVLASMWIKFSVEILNDSDISQDTRSSIMGI